MPYIYISYKERRHDCGRKRQLSSIFFINPWFHHLHCPLRLTLLLVALLWRVSRTNLLHRRFEGQGGKKAWMTRCLCLIYIYTLYNHIFIVVDIDSVDTSVCRVMCPLSIVSTIDLDRCNILMMKFISRLHPHLQFQRILGDLNPSFYLLSQISVYVFFCPKHIHRCWGHFSQTWKRRTHSWIGSIDPRAGLSFHISSS